MDLLPEQVFLKFIQNADEAEAKLQIGIAITWITFKRGRGSDAIDAFQINPVSTTTGVERL